MRPKFVSEIVNGKELFFYDFGAESVSLSKQGRDEIMTIFSNLYAGKGLDAAYELKAVRKNLLKNRIILHPCFIKLSASTLNSIEADLFVYGGVYSAAERYRFYAGLPIDQLESFVKRGALV